MDFSLLDVFSNLSSFKWVLNWAASLQVLHFGRMHLDPVPNL